MPTKQASSARGDNVIVAESSCDTDNEYKTPNTPAWTPGCESSNSDETLDNSPRSCDNMINIDIETADKKPMQKDSNSNSCILCLLFLFCINSCGIVGGFMYIRLVDKRVMKNCCNEKSYHPVSQALTNISNTDPQHLAEIFPKIELITMELNVSDLHDNKKQLTWLSTTDGGSWKNVQYRDGIFNIQTSGNYLIHSKLSIFTVKEFERNGLIKQNVTSFEHCIVILGEFMPLDCNMQSIFNGFKGPSHIWRIVYLTQGQKLVVKMSNKAAIYRKRESNRFQLVRLS